jgi:hypothetical protein
MATRSNGPQGHGHGSNIQDDVLNGSYSECYSPFGNSSHGLVFFFVM